MTSRFSSRCAALLVALAGASSVFASNTTTYTYDELGRLRSVTVSGTQASVQTYDYDPAGNRSQSTSGIVPPAPPSIVVPPSSITGSYTISWGASTGAFTSYQLQQATDASFSGQLQVYTASTTSILLSGRGNGTYYYRVRACSTSAACSVYTAGGNGTVVTLPPGPPSIGVPTSSTTGSYTIAWASPVGNVTGFDLDEATNPSFTGAVSVYSGTAITKLISGKGNGTYYYRVRACNTSAACGPYQPGSNGVSVTLPPSVPGTTSVPSPYSNSGSYSISWGASTGVVTAYEVLESLFLGTETLIYSGTATSTSVSARPDGLYSYRVRACNTSAACSSYNAANQAGGAQISVDKIAPAPPASVFMSTNGGYILSWSGGSTDTAGAGAGSGVGSWRVYRNGSNIGTSVAPMQSFTDPAPPTNVQLSYTARSVDRAGNESGNSPAASLYVDTVPPTTPGNFRATSVTTGSVTLAWNASTDAFGISWYRIARSGSGTVMGNGDASTTFVDNTVSSGTTYTYQVFAVDGHGVESVPASVQVTTPMGAPGTPLMNDPLFVPRNTTGSWVVSWSSVTGAANYKLSENGALTTLTTTSKSFSGRSNGTYNFQVKACGSNGLCGGFSDTKTVIVCRSGTSCE
jgi:hypothetical protein